MDPITQGIVGASASKAFSKNNKLVLIGLIGFLSALTPDLDIFFRSSVDPLLFFEYHRQFTHSLIFIPVGGLICSLIFFYTIPKKFGLSFKEIYFFATIGYGTHGLVDALTSYGTQLFWPFTDQRISFNLISVIDPLFTVPIIFLLIISIFKKNKFFVLLAIVWIFLYLLLSSIQKNRATDLILEKINQRGHQSNNLLVKPSFANIIIWKTIYEHNGLYYIDAVKLTTTYRFFDGSSIEKLNLSKSFSWLDKNSQQARDVERFSWFADGYLAISPFDSNKIIDVRYSTLPNKITPLWSIQLNQSASSDEHIKYIADRKTSPRNLKELLKMVFFSN